MTVADDYPMLEAWTLSCRVEAEARSALNEIDRLRTIVTAADALAAAVNAAWRKGRPAWSDVLQALTDYEALVES